MSKLLFHESEEPDILLVNNNNNNNKQSQLEEIEKEITPSLSLNKALYLLINIHERVFDKAVLTIRQSSKLEVSLKLIECKKKKKKNIANTDC